MNKGKKVKLIIIIISILIVLLIGGYLLMPKIVLNGGNVVKLEYNSKYVEKGSKCQFLGNDLNNKIKVKGSVNTKKVGTYKIKYSLKISFLNITKVRIVKVVDTKKPTITLEGDKNMAMCPNSEYKEPGYSAIDDYDGDLTEKVKVNVSDNKVAYVVKDSSGNVDKKVRNIRKEDKDGPVITLSGSENYYHKLGEAFKEPGYSVSDNCDGDLTKDVVIDGKVDVNKEGKYTLTYKVSDKSGNETKVVRNVKVYKKTDVNSGETKLGTIYLTFDDGPSSATTGKILDILKEEGVKATFFVTNNGPDNLIKREYEEGHSIALHTASHNYQKIYSSMDNYFNDLKIVSDRVKRITGHETFLIRFPGGSSNTVSRHYSQGIMTALTNEVLNRGYRYYDWNVDASDAWTCARSSVSDKASCVYNNVTKNLSKNKANVVLMHDIKPHTVEALRNIIKYGKDNGYTFDVINMNTAMVRFRVNN